MFIDRKNIEERRREFLHAFAQVNKKSALRITYPSCKPMAFEATSLADAKAYACQIMDKCPEVQRVTIWRQNPEAWVTPENWCIGRKWMATVQR
jgi:hypothetical protein